jgi:outer membrane protein, heavy metal efflux system
MRRTFARGLAACCLILGATSFSALSARSISLDELKVAVEEHPSLQQAQVSVDAARADLRETARWNDPVLGLSTTWSESLEGDYLGQSKEVELELDIPFPGRYRNAVAQARARLEASQLEVEDIRRELFSSLAARYWEIARDEAWRQSLDLSRQALAQSLDIAKRRVELGEARPVDLLRLEIELARLDGELRAGIAESEARRRNLARWLSLDADEELRVEAVFELPGEPLPFKELLARQERSHPQILAARSQGLAAEAGLRAESWGRIPDPSFRISAARESDAETIGLGIAFPLPLWKRNSPSVAAARAEVSAVHHESMRERLELAEALETARARLMSDRVIAATLKTEILPKAARAAEVLERMYEIGEVGVLEVIEARRDLMETELEGLDALLSCHLAHLDLQTLTGECCHENENH